MARGSSSVPAEGGGVHSGVEMIGGGGTADNRGKTTVYKKYFLTDAASLYSAPKVSGYRATNISFVRINNSAFEQNVTYESQDEESGDGSVFTDGGSKGTFEMFCSFETKPIAVHPRIDALLKQYQGYPEGVTILFPYYYIDTTASGLSDKKPAKNPMYGVTHYKEPSMILRHTYFLKAINGTIWNVTGKVTNTLPSILPIPKGDIDENKKEIPRQWMMQAPSVTRQGEAWQIIQEYVLLDATGVADNFYIKGKTPGTI